MGSVFGLLALAPLIYAGWREAAHAMTSGGFFFGELMLPKWPGRVIFLLGMVALLAAAFPDGRGDVRAMRRGAPLAETAYATKD